MDEQAWLSCRQPHRLLGSLFARSPRRSAGQSPSARDERFRRFATACCRRVQRALEAGDLEALDHLDRYIDSAQHEHLLEARRCHRPAGNAASNSLSTLDRSDRDAYLLAQARGLATSAVWTCTRSKPTQAAMAYEEAAKAATTLLALDTPGSPPFPRGEWAPALPAELAAQCDLVRDIFGNPFRPVRFDPAWRTVTTVALARQVHEEHDVYLLPILADALEEAGCNDDVLSHLRGSETHVRSCWAVALLLMTD